MTGRLGSSRSESAAIPAVIAAEAERRKRRLVVGRKVKSKFVAASADALPE